MAERKIDGISIGAVVGMVTFLIREAPRAKAASAIGKTSKNSHLQLNVDRINPDIVGPIAGATEMTIEILPIVLPRLSGGTRFMTVVINNGIMIAVPEACTIRPSTRTAKPGANAEISVPPENSDMARMKTGRVLSLCRR